MEIVPFDGCYYDQYIFYMHMHNHVVYFVSLKNEALQRNWGEKNLNFFIEISHQTEKIVVIYV